VDFSVSHHLTQPPEEVAAALLDEDFQRSLSDFESLKERTLESQTERPDGTVVRRTRCVLDIQISGAAKRFIGDGDPAWIEEAVWHPDKGEWHWVVIPEVGGNLLEAGGRVRITGEGDGTERLVTGRVKVNVPLYGGKVEGWIVDGIEHAYQEEAERLEAWLADRENA
jgi:hypothetical protein